MYYFTADEHYFHKNVIRYCNRPFRGLEEMHSEIINRHNEIVGNKDIVVHLGDFSFGGKDKAGQIIAQLNGHHIFIEGSHDKWLKGANQIWAKKIDDMYVVCCHYPMLSWSRSHYGSIQLFGHHHGNIKPMPRQMDVGVDTNNFYPYSFDDIKEMLCSGE